MSDRAAPNHEDSHSGKPSVLMALKKALETIDHRKCTFPDSSHCDCWKGRNMLAEVIKDMEAE